MEALDRVDAVADVVELAKSIRQVSQRQSSSVGSERGGRIAEAHLLLEALLGGNRPEHIQHQPTIRPDMVIPVDRDDMQRIEVDEVIRTGLDLPRFAVRHFRVELVRQDVQEVELDRVVRLGVGLRFFDALRGLREERRGGVAELGKVLEEELQARAESVRRLASLIARSRGKRTKEHDETFCCRRSGSLRQFSQAARWSIEARD